MTTMMTTFAMFGSPRSGSTTLVEYFRAVGVNIADEPLHPDIMRGRPFDMAEELSRLYREYEAVKHLYSHLSVAQNMEFVRYHLDGGRRMVYLKRRDRVLQAISEVLAMSTGFWEVGGRDRDAYARAVAETPLPVEAIQGAMDWAVRHEVAYDTMLMGPLVCTVYYEDIYTHGLGATIESVGRICAFLGTPPPEAATDSTVAEILGPGRKQNSTPVYRLIPNRREIEHRFGVALGDQRVV